MGGPIYGPGGVHIYPHGLRAGRRDGGHPALSMRSPVLDEFRTNKARKWELQDIFGYVVEFSGDQHGSRFIQQKLETATNEEKQAIFDEIVPANTLHLMQDVFGNYVIQKLFEYGSPVHKAILASTMEGHVLQLSLQLYGCRVVQKAIEYTPPERQALFVGEIESHVLECVQNANGNHVIQKMIERISPDMLGFIDAFKGHVGELSMHTYGCRVLQRCLEYLPEDRTRPLLDELHNHTLTLIQNSFGNYVVQFVLEHGQLHDRNQVLKALRGQMLAMSRHKFASNVCEKALLCADPDNRRVLIEELMTPDQEGVNPIVMMMKDQYANYVLQRALAVVDGHQKEQLSALIRPHLLNMRKHSSAYSKHLAASECLR
ncbi:ARM repeat-containing protein [Hymenopellis radicata]|nr:ARM repeat-containing protein [Hymenopellis radicata]